MTGIEREIQRNRRSVNRIESYYRVPAPVQSTTIAGPALGLEVDMSATVHTRPLSDSLIAGHPDASHQPGQAIAGDRRGGWTQQATTSTGVLVVDGRRALMQALTGAPVGITLAEVGDGTSSPTRSDSDLDNGAGQAGAWYQSATLSDARSTAWSADFRFDQISGTVSELGVWVDATTLAARLDVGDLAVSSDQELKIGVELTVSPTPKPNVALTDATAISNALASATLPFGIDQVAVGTDGTSPSQSDTALGGEVIRKAAAHDSDASSIQSWTVVSRNEPGTQPHDIQELALIDGDGNLILRSTFAAETKDDRTRMRPQQSVRL